MDVKNMVLVVNYDCPNHYEDYVHRVGRTGRAGNKGFAYTFILPESQPASPIINQQSHQSMNEVLTCLFKTQIFMRYINKSFNNY